MPEEPPRPRPLFAQPARMSKGRRIVLAGLVVIPLLVCGGIGIQVAKCPLGCPRDVTLQETAANSELTFPSGAELVDGQAENWTDWWLWATVRFPADRLDAFVADNALPTPIAGILRTSFDDTVAPKPEGTTFATISQTCTTDACRDMVLVLDDPAVVEAHVYVSENTDPSQPSASPTG